jgi:atypical dual specificity phosphatase
MSEGFDYSVAMNFTWVEQDRIAGCRGPRSDNDLAFLVSSGIRALVRLGHEDETGISKTDVESHGIKDCYEPVQDWNPPTQTQIDRAIGFVYSAIAGGKPVAVSCGAGCGRTGTVLACYLVASGCTPDDAIRHLLSVRPCSREILTVPGQREAILEFGRRRGRGRAQNVG